MKSAVAPPGSLPAVRRPGSRVLVAGLIAFAAALTSYLIYLVIHPPTWTVHAVDLHVICGGRADRPARAPVLPSALRGAAVRLDRPGLGLKFTYPPFAAVVFALVSLIPGGKLVIPGGPLTWVSAASDFALLLAALWFTFGGLGCREPRKRAGAALLAGAAGSRCWPSCS